MVHDIVEPVTFKNFECDTDDAIKLQCLCVYKNVKKALCDIV